MATKKKSARSSRVKSKGKKSVTAAGRDGVLRSNDIVSEQASASDDFVAAMPYNRNKELEHGHDNAVAPPPGVTVEPDSSSLTASTTSEKTETTVPDGSEAVDALASAFIEAIATHRHFSRESEPAVK